MPPKEPPASGSLGDRIRKARQTETELRHPPQRHGAGAGAAGLAWRMFADLLAGVMVGFGLGWSLDQVFGTTPVFLTTVGLLGTAGGIRLAMRTARAAERKQDGGTTDG